MKQNRLKAPLYEQWILSMHKTSEKQINKILTKPAINYSQKFHIFTAKEG